MDRLHLIWIELWWNKQILFDDFFSATKVRISFYKFVVFFLMTIKIAIFILVKLIETWYKTRFKN